MFKYSLKCSFHVMIKNGEIRPKLRRLRVSRKIRANSFLILVLCHLFALPARAPGDMWFASWFLISTFPRRCVPRCPVHRCVLAISQRDVSPSWSPEDTPKCVLVVALQWHRVSLTQPWPGLALKHPSHFSERHRVWLQHNSVLLDVLSETRWKHI